MKANAPEKLYIDLFKGEFNVSYFPTNNCVEYTRTDAFINKVCEWLKNFNDFHNIMRYSDCCEVPLEQIIDDFKNYIIEEKE